MLTEQELRRMFWASRRGMLELDLVLLPFVESRLAHLDAADQARYVQLLECEDTDLFAWFLQRQRPENPELTRIVDQILDFARTPRP